MAVAPAHEAAVFTRPVPESDPGQKLYVVSYDAMHRRGGFRGHDDFGRGFTAVMRGALYNADWMPQLVDRYGWSWRDVDAVFGCGSVDSRNVLLSANEGSATTYWLGSNQSHFDWGPEDSAAARVREAPSEQQRLGLLRHRVARVAVIEALYVTPDRQRQGYGTAAVLAALNEYDDRDVIRFTTLDVNNAMQAWGQKHGFQQTAEFEGSDFSISGPATMVDYQARIGDLRQVAKQQPWLGAGQYGTLEAIVSAAE